MELAGALRELRRASGLSGATLGAREFVLADAEDFRPSGSSLTSARRPGFSPRSW